MKKKYWYIGALLLTTIVFGVWKVQSQFKKTYAALKRGDIVESIYGLGVVTSSRTYRFKTAVTAEIRDLFVSEGDQVRKGQRLLLTSEGILATAPFDGTITQIAFHKGETTFPQSQVLTLIDTANRYITVSIEQEGALRVRRGQKAILSFENLRGEKIVGTVRTIYPSEDQFNVTIDVDSLPAQILPGMTADVAIEIDRRQNALLIPLNAVNKGLILISREGKNIKIPVSIGIADGELGEVVKSDLQPTDLIVLPKGP